MLPALRRLAPLAPILLAVIVWGVGTCLALNYALNSDEFIMAEVRRYGLVRHLALTLVWFALPYLAAGALAAWTARGLVRLSGSDPRPPGLLDAAIGCGLLLAFLAGSTILGMIERPALFAGLFYQKGGVRRALQLGLERMVSPGVIVKTGAVVGIVLLAAAVVGWWRWMLPIRRLVATATVLVLAVVLFVYFVLVEFRRPSVHTTEERPPAPAKSTPGASPGDTSSASTPPWPATGPGGSPSSSAPDGTRSPGSDRRTGRRASSFAFSRPNILLLAVDSLRADPIDPPPGQPSATPVLDRLAAESARFTDARTPLARTYPSWASLFTGLHPIRHGVRTHYPDADARRLAGMRPLPRALGEAGWTSIAVGGYCSTALKEMNLGFDEVDTPRSEADLIVTAVALRAHPLLPVWARAPWARELIPQVRAAIEGSSPDDLAREAIAAWRHAGPPFFETVFFDNTHLPYVPTWPESAVVRDYAGPNRYSLSEGNLVDQVRAGETAPVLRTQESERANARRLYAAAAHSVDRAIGRILAALDADDLTRDTIVIVLADHGENLLDHGGPLAHGEAAERDRSTTIPLIVRWPDRIEQQTIGDAVTVMDLDPTLLQLAGLHVPAGLDGLSLAARLEGGAPIPARPALFETGEWFFARDTVDRLDPTGRGLAYPDFDKGFFIGERASDPSRRGQTRTAAAGNPAASAAASGGSAAPGSGPSSGHALEPTQGPSPAPSPASAPSSGRVHIVIAPEYREAYCRAKERRLELGPWALTYLPRTTGAAFHLFRRDLDPWLERDLSATEPEHLRTMIGLFYKEAERLGERCLDAPEDPALRPAASAAAN